MHSLVVAVLSPTSTSPISQHEADLFGSLQACRSLVDLQPNIWLQDSRTIGKSQKCVLPQAAAPFQPSEGSFAPEHLSRLCCDKGL